ncbi:FAD-binding domain-containing protein [Penicillium macrosclerotiorum]|uniref:FAD-binding domain-containing protein n=1 Tax=Penicillium macrosclerotiorum TaxID=303699 RepID=UPI00254854C3|nr:FAD-binding domain-containing protein [Penicillium macrosclerotiorum]KAJ5689063.1 FAD-binding domain-containing protein [Penicillium macrosclerotiorum]
MPPFLQSLGIATAVLALVIWLLHRPKSRPEGQTQKHEIQATPNPLIEKLMANLPRRVLLPHRDVDLFQRAISTYYAAQECDVPQSAIVQPCDTVEVSEAIKVIKAEFDRTGSNPDSDQVTFAVRGGGQTTLARAASAERGVLIDLTHLREVTVADDRESVTIGPGARWVEVTQVLDDMGLGIVGGRSCDVGVAGFTLGGKHRQSAIFTLAPLTSKLGGISFFTPRYGLACSNTISYEVVLASGEIVTATATSHSDLWRALKGGSNNFGIVTRFTMRCFPNSKIWGGHIYAPKSQSTKGLMLLHENLKLMDPSISGKKVDPYASGPIACLGYVQTLGIWLFSVHLAYTDVSKESTELNKRPAFWENSGFLNLWRYWNNLKVRTVSSAIIQIGSGTFSGKRNSFGTTTIKNDINTIIGARDIFEAAKGSFLKVKGIFWGMIMQPLLPSWVGKGDPNMAGIHENEESLIIVSLSVSWVEAKDDELVYKVIREILDQVDDIAATNGAGHLYRYINYCEKWQKPLEGYGQDNLQFLRSVSKVYDPDGLFQKGCTGGFKLG